MTGARLCRHGFSTSRALRVQRLLSSKLVMEPPEGPFDRVLGVDASYIRSGKLEVGVGVAVLVDLAEAVKGRDGILGCVVNVSQVCVPYIPGFLAFRELSLIAPAARLAGSFDVAMVDGHGIAHPRGFGIASHLGVVLDKPSIGVAKRRLVGVEVEESGRRYVVVGGVKVAIVVPRGNTRLYVSPGHRMDLETAESVVERSILGVTPEPIRYADSVSKAVRSILKGMAVLSSLPECRVFYSKNVRALVARLERLGFEMHEV